MNRRHPVKDSGCRFFVDNFESLSIVIRMEKQIKPPFGILATCNLDNANWHLRQGSATEEEANAYVAWWNTPGNRLTKAEVYHYTVPQGYSVLKVPQIRAN